jgi:membrane protease YdiL (CAAX protease family)
LVQLWRLIAVSVALAEIGAQLRLEDGRAALEEVVFRGLLYGWVAGRWGTTVAWFVSSALFAAAHSEPAHALLVLPLGLWFGWLRQRTDSLWPSLVAHVANNSLAVVAAALINT